MACSAGRFARRIDRATEERSMMGASGFRILLSGGRTACSQFQTTVDGYQTRQRDSAERQKSFYEWYNTAHHFPAGFIRDTFQKIFINNELIHGSLRSAKKPSASKIIRVRFPSGHWGARRMSLFRHCRPPATWRLWTRCPKRIGSI